MGGIDCLLLRACCFFLGARGEAGERKRVDVFGCVWIGLIADGGDCRSRRLFGGSEKGGGKGRGRGGGGWVCKDMERGVCLL